VLRGLNSHTCDSWCRERSAKSMVNDDGEFDAAGGSSLDGGGGNVAAKRQCRDGVFSGERTRL
jgi:hypothetical protein